MTFWNLKNDAEIPEDGVLDIDGEIVAEPGWFTGPDACVASDFRKALKGVKNVTVHINSPGGDVIAGAEIYSALREHSLNGEGSVTVIVTGIAASAASIIAMAGDRILMHPVAYMMIHNPWTVAMGDAKELRKAAKVLDVIAEGLVSTYQARTGKDKEELEKMLANETWMSAATCVEEGFADEIYGAGSNAAASAVRPTMMSMKAHGLQEITARMPDQDDPGLSEEEIEKRAEIVKRVMIANRAVEAIIQ
ncbi:MAG: Clp protease ClpP [Clostridia bacterium]|nr:Clp protease ClpP [Clostridia bacterium]